MIITRIALTVVALSLTSRGLHAQTDARMKHWSFQPIKSINTPLIPGDNWSRTPIDRFILEGMKTHHLTPAPIADRRTLLRRVTYDLTGLPPSPTQMSQFLAGKNPKAYEKVVDRLLASPQYGEQWGRHWLDVVHYGDTHGYDKDKRRPNAWRYRDYVIHAFNKDVPYSQFIREQIAGDMVSPGTKDGVVATGFVVAGPWDFVGEVELAEGTVEKEKTRLLDRDDMVANVMSTFNSVTIHCARCHDHKFDPISQREYYRLQAVFAGVERGDRIIGDGDEASDTPSPSNGYHSGIEAQPDVTKWVQIDLGKSVTVESLRLLPARPTDFPDTPGFGFPVRFTIAVSDEPLFTSQTIVDDHSGADFANPKDKLYVVDLHGVKTRYIRVQATRLWPRTNDYIFALAEVQTYSGGTNVARGNVVTAKDSIEQGRWSTKFLTDGCDSRHAFGISSYAVVPRMSRTVQLLSRGDVESPIAPVEPGSLSCVAGMDANLAVKTSEPEGARRLALANWIADPKNSLTWRSIVNRVWQYHFGKGIVDTPNDFGRNGSAPTHPELLDWMANWFASNGQSIKKLHKMIVMSSAYMQSSSPSTASLKLDSDNKFLSRMNRRRLDAEEIRDSVLTVSGNMNLEAGGPGYDLFRFKDDHSPIYDFADTSKMNDPKTFRRTIYRFIVRSVPNPFLDCLDGADPNINTPVRNTTMTALQSLALWNNPFMIGQEAAFAGRIRNQSPDVSRQIACAYERALNRAPTSHELELAKAYIQKNNLESFCRILLNTSEFVFID